MIFSLRYVRSALLANILSIYYRGQHLNGKFAGAGLKTFKRLYFYLNYPIPHWYIAFLRYLATSELATPEFHFYWRLGNLDWRCTFLGEIKWWWKITLIYEGTWDVSKFPLQTGECPPPERVGVVSDYRSMVSGCRSSKMPLILHTIKASDNFSIKISRQKLSSANQKVWNNWL